MLSTRPDIIFTVLIISRYSANFIKCYIIIVKKVFRYLKNTLFIKFIFRGELALFSGYTNSDYAGDYNTRRSTSSYIFNLGSAAIF